MQTCVRCGVPKPLSEFPKKTGKSKHGYCKECQRAYTRAHYAANKQTYIDRAQRRKEEVREKINELKRVPCADCGGRFNPWQMDFDHVRGVKEADIARLVITGSTAKLRAEMAKCEVVCANCHRQRTHERLSL